MFSSPRLSLSLVALAGMAGVTLGAAQPAPDFNREVRPILSNFCFKCHGPDDKARKGGLRLDLRESALKEAKSGALAIVPGKVEESELAIRIGSDDEEEIMPPPATGKVLTAAQKDILKRWIGAGAEYRPHWAFLAPKAVTPPVVERAGSAPANPIDGFVRARLKAEGLAPSPEADRATLIRRVSLDLIGLPPTPEEARAFINDPSPDAYEKLVDRLLASPHYGERWARRWLDLARYADTNGYEKDRTRSIWPWRDWVINAINADKPFDQFTIEQLAGDLLPNPTRDQLVATGFHRNTMLNEEGGIDPLEYRFHAMTDRVATTGVTWLGLSVGCAQCHTHKFDPIQHREYYQIMAFLNNADEPDLDLLGPDAAEQQKAREAKLARLLAALPAKWPNGPATASQRWETAKAMKVETTKGQAPRLLEDGSVLFGGTNPDRDTYTASFETAATGVKQLRLEALADASLPAGGPGRVKHGNFVLSEISVLAGPVTGGDMQAVKLIRAEADASQKGFPIEATIDGKTDTGWAVEIAGTKWHANHTATFTFQEPVSFPGGTRFEVKLDQLHGNQHTIGRMRLSVGVPVEKPAVETPKADGLEKKFSEWLTRERARTVAWTVLTPSEAHSNLPLLTVQPDGSVFASGDISKDDVYQLKVKVPAGATAFRLEALPDERLPNHGPGMTYYEGPKGDFFLREFQMAAGGQAIKFARATESYSKNSMGHASTAALAVDGDLQTGWSAAGRPGQASEAVFPLATPLVQGGELAWTMHFGRHFACSLGRFRLSFTSDPRPAEAREMSDEAERLLALPDARLTAAERDTLRRQFLLVAPELAGARKEIDALRQEPRAPATTLIFQERPPENPRPTFIYNRGEFLQPTERVEPGVFSFLPGLPPKAKADRLAFARWLVAPENPLTARVTVNRQWGILFGRGLVRTTDDFGYQGESPSHPELLDWLAVDFVRQGWSLKKLTRLMVTSATYRQSSRVTPELLSKDKENVLLARGPRGRLEAEMVRDATLTAAGLLSPKLGGPSVYPPQPDGVSEVAYGSPKWPASSGEDRYRRGLYTFAKRTAPYAMLTAFDGPAGDACLARREISNSSLQALTLLNDVVFVEAAQALGKLMSSRPGTVEERINEVFWRCLTRPPSVQETTLLAKFWKAQKDRCVTKELDALKVAGEGPGDMNERAAWTVLARAVFNLDEAITKS